MLGQPRGGAGTHGRWSGDCDDPHRRRDRRPLPLQLFDSSTGFFRPRGADALRRKMALYQANGAQLGWQLFPEQRAVEIWAS